MQTPIPKDIDGIFAQWNRTDSPGCALAVMKDGEVIYRHGYGMANLEYGVPIGPDTIFHVASVSKQFTNFAVVLLAQENKLTFEDEARQHLPWLPDFGERITLRHLAHHTSGLRDQWELLVEAGWRMDDVITTADVLRLVKRQRELNFKPGEEYIYCNTGYTLLAQVVEAVSGIPFAEFCRQRIFAPLGMTRTHFHNDHTLIVPGRAYSYAGGLEKGFKHEVLSYANAGATSLFTTVEDLARWDENFYTGAVGGTAAVEMMHSTYVLNSGIEIPYRLGIVEGKYRGLRTVEHSGADAGFRSVLLRFPDQHFSVAILANLADIQPAVLARKVTDLYLGSDYSEQPLDAASAGVSLPEGHLAPLAGVYFNPRKAGSWKLELKDDKLYLVMWSELELVPLSKTRFSVAGQSGMEIEFLAAEGVMTLKLPGGAQEICEKLAPIRLTPVELSQFTGRYYSQELDVPYEVELQGEKLRLVLYRYGGVDMEAIAPDAFRADMKEVTGEAFPFDVAFSRDEQGKATALFLSCERVRRSRFDRVS